MRIRMDHLGWWFPMTVPQWEKLITSMASWGCWSRHLRVKKMVTLVVEKISPTALLRSLLSPTCPCAKIFRLQREVPGQPHFETKPTVSILRLFSGWNHGSFCRAGPVVLQHLDVAWQGDNDNSSELRHGWAAFEHLSQPWASQIWAFIVSSVSLFTIPSWGP